ncbi:MAG TPA: RlmE family RNA methyltransferase [Dongiaceae bacterium]|jgi:23S rRNA (uridine2552-2'-O)-methyltransferase|nr:RlmE family RNA methyltransferase [Dongiaceae bacterium]
MTTPPSRSGGRGARGGRGGRGPAGTGTRRGLAQRVQTAHRRTLSSTLWLERQLNDPYVAEAKRLGYRSRAAFKLLQLDDRFGFLKPGARVLDLGAAPGGWTQVAVERVIAKDGKQGRVVGIDLNPVDAIAGAELIVSDFLADDVPEKLKLALGGQADVVLSDMAAPSTGHAPTDHLRIIGLAEAALAFAVEILKPGGVFVAKVLQGGSTRDLLAALKRDFREVRHVKPMASRADSAEIYVVAQGFRKADSSTI